MCDTISPMVYIPPSRYSWKVSIFPNKRSIDSSQWSKHRRGKMWSVVSTYWKKRFNILVIADRSYSQRILDLIMRACIILHNMIIDDERDCDCDDNHHTVASVVAPPVTYEAPSSLTTILQRDAHLTSGVVFLSLQSNLIEHVWNKFHLLNLFNHYVIFFLIYYVISIFKFYVSF
jgi:hypothetical protein